MTAEISLGKSQFGRRISRGEDKMMADVAEISCED
jgi:hypothetical protein